MERINVSKMIEGELVGKSQDNLGAQPVKPEEFKMSAEERLEIKRRWKKAEEDIKVE